MFRVQAGDSPATPPLAGRYRLQGAGVEFIPRWPPARALTLLAAFTAEDGQAVTERFTGEQAAAPEPRTRVASVTPSAGAWPENLLRLYISFSGPMRVGEAWPHIRLLDEAGAPVPGPFVEIDQELWDPAGRRLTVLFDPARIKRGLVDHEAEGLPLVPGRRYTLEIDPAWRDAAGAPMLSGYKQPVVVTEALREPIDPAAWRIVPPSTPDAALTVDFGRPMDAALALRALTVRKGAAEVLGEARLTAHETRWVFQPATLWTSGPHTLAVADWLEDIAGNRPGRPFDIDRRASPDAVARGADLRFKV